MNNYDNSVYSDLRHNMQDAICEFREHAPAWYETRTLYRMMRLMVLIRAVLEMARVIPIPQAIYEAKWKLASVETDGSLVLTMLGPSLRMSFHVYDPVKVSSASRGETGWVVSTYPHWLLASGQLDTENAWGAICWLFDMFITETPETARYGAWR